MSRTFVRISVGRRFDLGPPAAPSFNLSVAKKTDQLRNKRKRIFSDFRGGHLWTGCSRPRCDGHRAPFGNAVAVPADVSKGDEVSRLYGTVEQQLGTADVVINNAGNLKTVPLAQTSGDLFAQTFAINVGGVFNMLREAATRVNETSRVLLGRSQGIAPLFRANRAHRLYPTTALEPINCPNWIALSRPPGPLADVSMQNAWFCTRP